MRRTFLSYLIVVICSLSSLYMGLPSVFASINFNDSRSLTLGNNPLTLYMGQDGNNFYLDAVNPSGKPLSCEIKEGNTLLQRSNCTQQSFSYYGLTNELKIYVQLDNDQGTWLYDTYTKTFTSALRGTIDVTNNNNNYNNNQITSLTVIPSTLNTTTKTSISIATTLRDQYNNIVNNTNNVTYTVEKLYNNSRSIVTFPDYAFSVGSLVGNLNTSIGFSQTGIYRIKATYDNIYGYSSTITVGNSNSTSNSLSVDTNTTNPSTNQYLTTYTTIRDNNGNRDYNYQGTIRYTVEKRDNNNSSNWNTASNSDYLLSPTTSYFSSSDQGYKILSSHLLFYNNGYYRLKAMDDSNSNTYSYTYITVANGVSSTTLSSNRFDLSSNTITPGRDNFTHLTITAKDNNGYTVSSYNNRVRFQVYRRVYTSDAWTEITSSSLDNSAYRIYDTSYTFPSYNNGTTTISNFIKFYFDSYDYKVRVVDDYNSNIYGEIIYYLRNTSDASNNNSSSTSAYRFAGTLDDAVPELNTYFDAKLYVKDSSNNTITNYNKTVKITLERKALAGSTTWSSTSSTYCRLDRSSYSFSTSDYGYVTLRDLVRCSKKGFYRLKFVDSNNSSVYGYLYFTIVDTDDFVSSLAGFDSSQRNIIQELYRTFMSNINEQELNSTTLSRNSSWASTWKSYYTKLNALAYNKIGRLKNYSAWLDAANTFNDNYTRLR